MFRAFHVGQHSLRPRHEYHIQLFLACLNLPDNVRICLPAHPRWLWRWRTVWTVVVGHQLAVQACQTVVRAIHRPAALDGVAEMVAVPARKEPAATVEL
jgi:hypothetical protein